MHEMALAESMIAIVEDAARRNGAARVASVRLELGALSHVERDALVFCFDAVTRGGPAEGARLDVAVTPGAAWCMRCSERVPLSRLGDACPRCSGYQLQVVAGDGMRVTEIEVA